MSERASKKTDEVLARGETRHSELPRSRTDDLIVRDLADEVVVFDQLSSKAHCLNSTAALVWRRCDGRSTPADIAREAGLDENAVRFALDALSKAKLVEEWAAPSLAFAGMTRRQALRLLKTASAGVAVPLVFSILAPTVAEAASCIPKGSTGCHSIPCCAGLTCSMTPKGHCH